MKAGTDAPRPGGGPAGPLLSFHVTVRGAAHLRQGRECQDFSGCARMGEAAAAAVADGHGDIRYFRSALGSRFAVESALEAVRALMKCGGACAGRADAEDEMAQLKKNVILKWNHKVRRHLRGHPFLEEELAPLSEGRRARLCRGEDAESAYGTTLIAAAVAPEFWFGLQIGDGDCVAGMGDGSLRIVPKEEGLAGNWTTSLCEPDAIDKFHHLFSRERPVSVALTTDGVRNSFSSEEYYMSFIRKVIGAFAERKLLRTRRELEAFLREMTRRGSGDDLSVAGLIDGAALPVLPPSGGSASFPG